MRYLFLFALLALLGGCSRSARVYDKAFVDLDSLVNEQVLALVRSKAALEKNARMGGKTDSATFAPDSLQWAHELDVFRQLDVINKPSFRQVYEAQVARDTQSNLQVLTLKSKQPTSIPYIHFYFFERPSNLKKIEARFEETNTLFSSVRDMQMAFDEEEGKPLLTSYRVEGIQKMILGDSVLFSVQARVRAAH